MKLAELTYGFDAIEQALDANGGELTDELAARLHELDLAEREKVDRLVFVIRALEGEAEKYKKLEDEIAAKKKAKQRSRDSLLAYVHRYLDARREREIRGEFFRFQLVKSGKPPVEVLVPAESLPREWTTVTTVPNKDVIRKYLEAGVSDSTLARLGEPTYSVRIY